MNSKKILYILTCMFADLIYFTFYIFMFFYCFDIFINGMDVGYFIVLFVLLFLYWLVDKNTGLSYYNFLSRSKREVLEYQKKQKEVKNDIVDYKEPKENVYINESEIMIKICELDEYFSREKFETYAESIFLLVMNCYSINDYKKLRMYEVDDLYNHHESEMLDLKRNNKKRVRSMISIKSCILDGLEITDDKCYLSVVINANLKDYVADSSGNVLSGDFYKHTNKKYYLKFVRDKNVKSTNELNVTNCPKCGAVIKINNDGVCNYCNSSLVKGTVSWSLFEFYEKM